MDFGTDPTTLLTILITLVISISIHEMMHALVGDKLGDTTARDLGRVSLNPLRHVDPFATILLPILTLILFHVPILAAKPVPFNPDRVKYDEFGAAMIAAAGPVSNFVLAALGALLAHGFAVNADIYNALTIFVSLNIGLFVFNLIPIPPLDGSRVLYAFAPEAVQEFMAQLEQWGIFIVFGLVLFVPAFIDVLSNIMSNLTLFLL
jgi:Zn-dependent protease